MPSVTIIGVGRVGGALEIAFRDSEYRVDSLILRSDPIERVSSEIVMITTPDGDIAKVADGLAGSIAENQVVLHTSGALTSGELSVLADAGCATGSLHPLVSISSAEIGAKRFRGAYFCVEGDLRAVEAAKAVVSFLGGHSFEIPAASKALYHAAAVTACGHVTALIDMAFSMMGRAGVEAGISKKILHPLIQSTLDNLKEQGAAAALTGTFARADAEGLRRQLAAFEGKLDDEELAIYLGLARRSLDLARQNGVDTNKIEETEALIYMAKTRLR